MIERIGNRRVVSHFKQAVTFFGIIVYYFNMNIFRRILKRACESEGQSCLKNN